MLKAYWTAANLGIFIILLGVLGLFFGPARTLPWTLGIFGLWLIVLSAMRKVSGATTFEYPPAMIFGWGFIIAGVGFLWISISIFPQLAFQILSVVAIIVGAVLLVQALMRPQQKQA